MTALLTPLHPYVPLALFALGAGYKQYSNQTVTITLHFYQLLHIPDYFTQVPPASINADTPTPIIKKWPEGLARAISTTKENTNDASVSAPAHLQYMRTAGTVQAIHRSVLSQ